ncbi:MAG: Xaa-Pro peptidase family protein [Candidatus Thorarchaeota archaeon]|nr:Xaa-Pro peptidase family protein [Candidatus Thorarchaeota archaeon]
MASTIEKAKCKQALELLKELDLDSWLVWVRETSQMADPVLELILGGDLVWESALLFTKAGEKVAIVGNFDAGGLESSGIYDKVIPYTKGISEVLVTELARINPQKIGINYSKDDVAADGLTVGMYEILKNYLKKTPYIDRLVSAESLIQRLRGRKTAEEVESIRKAIAITEEIFHNAESHVRAGQSECEIYDFFHSEMRKYGVTSAWNDADNPAVDAGPNKQFGHAGPTDNMTKAGHLLHFDFGVRYKGYCSDIQRMFFFGEEKDIPSEVQEAFVAVRDAIFTASKFIRPGRLGYEVDAIARDSVRSAGYEEYQHALGHQLGRNAHDGGVLLGPQWERYGTSVMGPVEIGNIFTLELYVTTKDYGQLSLEEDIVVTKTGCQFLTRRQQKLICIK